MISLGHVLLTTAALLASAATVEAADAAVVLTRDGAARVPVLIPADADTAERLAASEVASYLRKITGATFAIQPERGDEARGIFVGRTRPAEEFRAERDSVGTEGYVVDVSSGRIVLTGGGPFGTLYGAYAFLEHLGVRWYAPGDLGEVVPSTPTLEVQQTRMVSRPAFALRWVGFNRWSLRNGANSIAVGDLPRGFTVAPRIYHTQRHIMPTELCLDEHPEYYALVDGSRMCDRDVKLCYGNPEVAAVVAERMLEMVRASRSIDLISFSPTDGQNWCECDLCLALDEDVTASDVRYSRRSLIFYNRIASEMRSRLRPGEAMPEILVGAYNVYNRPPLDTSIRADSSLSVIITHYDDYCKVHPIDDPACPKNAVYRDLVRAWQDRGARNVYYYEYYLKGNWFGLPWPIVHGIRRDIPWYASVGSGGVYTQYNNSNTWTYLLDYYVAAKLLWDPHLDVDALLDEFYRRFYGPAAEPMRAYYEELEAAMLGTGRHFPGNAAGNASQVFTPSLLKRIGDLVASARVRAREADTQDFAERVERVRLELDYADWLMPYLRARREVMSARTPEDVARATVEARDAYDGVIGYLGEHGSRLDGLGVLRLRAARKYLTRVRAETEGRFERGRFDLVSSGLVNRWLIAGPFDNTDWEGHVRAYLPETQRDPEAEYVGKDGRELRWEPYDFRPWDGYVDLDVFLDDEDWAVAYALAWVEADQPIDAQVRLGSNDSVVLWIGDEKVHDNDAERLATVDEDIVPVRIPAGRTPILVKIGQSGGSWGLFFRITDEDGEPIDGLRYTLEP